jgi:membrane protein DedA with SNARE-associated domain
MRSRLVSRHGGALNRMNDWVIRLIEQSGYLGVGFLMFLETVFPPIPSEVIMPVAGMAAAEGKLNYWFVVASGTAGAMLGNIVWYLAARALGVGRMEQIIRRHGRWVTMTWPEVERAQVWFRRNGVFFVFLGRLLPTVRSLVSIPAGLLKMRFKTFFIASTIGTLGWTALLATAGFKLRENFSEVDQYVGTASNAIIAVLVAGYFWRLWTHRHSKADD